MTSIQTAWLPVVLFLALATPPAAAAEPEQDIVTVVSATPVPDMESVPGLLTGQRITDGLRSALELVNGGVPEAARPGLEELSRELRQLQTGDDNLGAQLPATSRDDGELWLPVEAERLQVRLDAPDLNPRPRSEGTGGTVGNLPARARRITWLPVGLTLQRVESVLSLLTAGEQGQAQARQLLETTLRDTQSQTLLEDRPLILAYYQVEAALAAAPRWDETIRGQLRQTAETLTENAVATDLADRIQAEADRLTPDMRGLQELSIDLRKHILQAAGALQEGNAPEHRP